MGIFQKRLQDLMYKNHLKGVDLFRICQPICKEKNTSISTSDISLYLSGKRIPKINKIKVLAEVFNVSPNWLLGDDNEQIKNSILVGTANNSIIQNNSKIETTEVHLTEEQKELLNLFAQFDFKERHEIFTFLYKKLEEKKESSEIKS